MFYTFPTEQARLGRAAQHSKATMNSHFHVLQHSEESKFIEKYLTQVHHQVLHTVMQSVRNLLPQQVNTYVYTEKCTLLYKRELRTLKQQRLTLFLGTWLHLLPVTFPAASETPQQTPSDNEQECTQSDTHSYTHTHTHTRMTYTVHAHTHITHSNKSYMYIKMLVPTKCEQWALKLTIATAAQNRRYKQTECTTEDTVMNAQHCTVRTYVQRCKCYQASIQY